MEPLYKLRGMWPYLVAMFMNAFVDLGHKIIIQNTIFKIHDGNRQIVLTAIVNSLILLPYIALFTPAGFISDRFAKDRVMRVSAWIALLITSLITLCYYRGWFWPAFMLTLALGAQAAIYSPAKYGYIKPLVGERRLSAGNGIVQAITIVAILAGTFVYTILFEQRFARLGGDSETNILRAIAPLGWLLVINTAIELYCTYRLPRLEAGDSSLRLTLSDYFRGRTLSATLAPWRAHDARYTIIRLSIIGLAVFWAVSQVMLAAFPAFAKAALAIHNTILLQGMLATSGIGIIIGSMLAARLSRQRIATWLVPIGAAGIALGLAWLPLLHAVALQCANFLFIGTMGGIFIVPLNAMMQLHAGAREMGRVLAVNNLVQNIAMFGFLMVTAVAALGDIDMVVLLWMIAFVAAIGMTYTIATLRAALR